MSVLQAGEYRHFKGKLYELYCMAFDEDNKAYILYRPDYGQRGFWLRPYDMFFEKVKNPAGELVWRFQKTDTAPKCPQEQVKRLMAEGEVYPVHSETEERYRVIGYDEKGTFAYVVKEQY